MSGFLSCDKLTDYLPNTEPVAIFTVDPTIGNTRTDFSFDPSGSFDEESSSTNLKARWDWEGDGSWDTGYDFLTMMTWQYDDEGVYNVKLEVKDPEGLTNQTSKEVIVSNSSGGDYVVTFWTQSDKEIMVYVEGDHIGTITRSYTSSPSCYSDGCVTYESSTPDVTYYAESTDGSSRWSEKTRTFIEGCNKLHLRVTTGSDETTEIIGQSGGSISHEKLELNIPSGSFSGNNTITISADDSPDEFFFSDTGADIYKIEGLPDDFTSPIEVKFNVSQVSDEDLAITLGGSVFIKSLGDDRISSLPLDTEKNGDYITAFIQPDGSVPSPKSSNDIEKSQVQGTLWLSWITNSASYTSSLFKITYKQNQVSNSSLITDLHTYLVNAYNITINDFNLSWGPRTTWPIEVVVKKLSAAYDGQFVDPWYKKGFNANWLEFNSLVMTQSSLVEATVMHEVFHFVQDLYNSSKSSIHYWFDEASSVWSQDLVSMGSTSNSQKKPEKLQPFYGMQNTSVSGWSVHGYGMSFFLKYLVDKKGNSVFKNIYGDISLGSHVIQSIDLQLGNGYSVWFPDFIKDYLEGNLYGELAREFDELSIVKECIFTSSDDNLKQFQESVYDLGCDLYKLPLSYNYIEDTKLKFNLSGLSNNGQMKIFKYKILGGGQYMELIADNVNNYTIDDIKSLKDQGYRLMVAIINSRGTSPYTGSLKYTLDIIKEEPIIIDYSKVRGASVSCKVLGTFTGTEAGTYNYDMGTSGSGSFSSSRVTVNEGGFDEPVVYISLNINTTDDIILSGEATEQGEEGVGGNMFGENWADKWDFKINFNSLEVSGRNGNNIIFAAYGDEVQGLISNIDLKEDHESHFGTDPENWAIKRELTSFSINSDSYLIVTLIMDN